MNLRLAWEPMHPKFGRADPSSSRLLLALACNNERFIIVSFEDSKDERIWVDASSRRRCDVEARHNSVERPSFSLHARDSVRLRFHSFNNESRVR
jgi:hypothetical protein